MGNCFDYDKIGKRIKAQREGLRYKSIGLNEYEEYEGKTVYIYPKGSEEGKKLSIDKLLIWMSENGLHTMRKQNYIDLEHGKPDIFRSVKLEQLNSLCIALQCDISYIFGLTDFPTKDIETVHNTTGLSKSAILKLARKNEHNRMYSKITSWIIEHNGFDSIINRINSFIQIKWLQAASDKMGNPDKKLDKELTKEEERLFAIAHRFTSIIEDIAKKETK